MKGILIYQWFVFINLILYIMAHTIEDLIVKKIDGGIRGIKQGTKSLDEAKVMYYITKLDKINDGLSSDYLAKYLKLKAEKLG